MKRQGGDRQMKRQTNVRMSDATRKKLDQLTARYGTQAEAVAVALDRLYRAERRSNKMTGAELFDLFVVHGVGTDEIARMSAGILAQQIHELRTEPDDIDMSNGEIARAILAYAKEDSAD